jgi:hypothetical protein
VPTFALLQTKNEQRLKQWEPFVKPGRAVSMQTLGSQTATDAAVRLSIAAPTSQADFSLAVEHRPLLLFDSDEPVPRPLSVASLFSEKRVRLCRDRAVQTKCSQPIRDATELQNGRTHLQLELPKSEELRSIAMRENGEIGRLTKLAATTASSPGSPPHATPPPDSPITDASGAVLGQGSTIYVHPVSSERDGRQLLYLDYWWYLPDNPAGGLGLGAFCGAGLVIPGVTCHNHESDWEGLTVVVDRTEAKPVVTAVQYAQHDDVLRYDWHALVRRWHREKVLPALTKVAEASGRPLAFSARGTHSTYPTPCDPCHQVVNDNLNEDKHRGDLPWIGNYTLTCGDQDCLQMLPTREGGSQPALWNAFAGLWGTRRCVLVFYCDSGSPPAAPGRQERYKHPTFYDGVVGEDGTFKSQPFDG